MQRFTEIIVCQPSQPHRQYPIAPRLFPRLLAFQRERIASSSLVSPPNEKFFTPVSKTESPQAAFDSSLGFPHKPLLIYSEVSALLVEGLLGLIGICTVKQMFGQPKHLADKTQIISALYAQDKQKLYGNMVVLSVAQIFSSQIYP